MLEKKPMGSSEQLTEELNDSVATFPSHEQIARLAYILWQTRGATHGSPEQDWFEAERQLGVANEKAQVA